VRGTVFKSTVLYRYQVVVFKRPTQMMVLVVTSISKTANSQNLTFFAGLQLLSWGIGHSTHLCYCMVKSCWSVHGVWWFQQSRWVLQGMSLFYISCGILELLIEVSGAYIVLLILLSLLVMLHFSSLNGAYLLEVLLYHRYALCFYLF